MPLWKSAAPLLRGHLQEDLQAATETRHLFSGSEDIVSGGAVGEPDAFVEHYARLDSGDDYRGKRQNGKYTVVFWQPMPAGSDVLTIIEE